MKRATSFPGHMNRVELANYLGVAPHLIGNWKYNGLPVRRFGRDTNGLPHRMPEPRQVGGVNYWTTVEASGMAALLRRERTRQRARYAAEIAKAMQAEVTKAMQADREVRP